LRFSFLDYSHAGDRTRQQSATCSHLSKRGNHSAFNSEAYYFWPYALILLG